MNVGDYEPDNVDYAVFGFVLASLVVLSAAVLVRADVVAAAAFAMGVAGVAIGTLRVNRRKARTSGGGA